jgi:hypothetical protein
MSVLFTLMAISAVVGIILLGSNPASDHRWGA